MLMASTIERGGVVDLVHVWKLQAREPGDPIGSAGGSRQQRSENFSEGNADMNADGNSDESVVPANPANNDGTEPSAESAEERLSAKRNTEQY